MKKLLLLMLGVLMALPTFARDFSYTYEDQTLTYTVISEDDKTVKTKEGSYGGGGYAGNDVSGDLIIPANVKDGDTEYTVTEIGESAFYRCRSLTSITIPNSVQTIDSSAFANCSGLTSITIPNSVTSIGSSAFASCSGLTSITIPNSVTSIGIWTFRYCSGLTEVIIPDSVTSIGDYTFANCSGLTSITIPNSVTSIGNDAFVYCSGLTEVIIPESVTSIGSWTFLGCSGLKSVTIPNSVTSIGARAFENCISLTEVIIPNSVTSIDYAAFRYCSGLTEVIIGNSVTEIGGWTFDGCTGLKKSAYPKTISNPFSYGITVAYDPDGAIIEYGLIFGPEKKAIYYASLSLECEYVIPESVTSIGEYAFMHCSKLQEIMIPNKVTAIGSGAFQDCTSLIKAAYPSGLNNPFESSIAAIKYDSFDSRFEDGFIYSRRHDKLYYVPTTVDEKFTVPETVTEITAQAFYGCKRLTEIVLPAELSTLGENVWQNCPAIESVVYTGAKPIEANHNIFDVAIYDEATLYVPKGQKQTFMKANPWGYFYHIDDKGWDGVEDVTVEMEDAIDFDKEYEVYSLGGAWVGNSLESLSHGFYIVRQGKVAKKIAIK